MKTLKSKTKKNGSFDKKNRSVASKKNDFPSPRNFSKDRNNKSNQNMFHNFPNSSGRWCAGIHSVKEALRVTPNSVLKLCFSKQKNESLELEFKNELLNWRGKIELVSDGALDSLGCLHQGVACKVQSVPQFPWEELKSKSEAVVLILDGIEDPHNLGAIIRTAWLMGISGIISSSHRSAPLTPTVHKIACGGVEHVPVYYSKLFSQEISRLKEMGFWVYGLDHGGKDDIWTANISEKTALVVGSESNGVRSTVKKDCDNMVKIFQVDAQASYNASVATAMALSEIVRRQKNTVNSSK